MNVLALMVCHKKILKDFFLKFYVKKCAPGQSPNMTPEDNFNNSNKGSLDESTSKI